MDADNIRSPLDQLAQKKKTYETDINIQKSCIHLMLNASCKLYYHNISLKIKNL
jgi:hypothetical protein